MDSEIYKLLARAEQEKNVEFLRKAYLILDPDTVASGSQKDKSTKDIENFGQNLYVECAEKAISFEETHIAERCLQIYFSLPRISNQFLARAYLCQFEIAAPKATNQLENLEKSMPFLFKALEFAKSNKRYNFLVYNASIIFWKYARAFMKTNFRLYLCSSLKALTDSLREIDDADYEWRAFLERTLVEAYLDNKQLDEANVLAKELQRFIRNYLPDMFNDYFEFLVYNGLLNDEDLRLISSRKWELSAVYRIEKLKKITRASNKKQPGSARRVVSDDESSNTALNEDAILNELNEIYKLLIPKNKYHSELTASVEESSEFMKSREPEKKDDLATVTKRQRLLLNLAHVCLQFEEVNLCSQILGYLKETDMINEEFSLELDFLDCDLTIKSLRHKQERYQKSLVRVRVEVVHRFDELLRNAKRLLNPRLIQLGCMMQWSIILPLLQSGIRNQIRKPLQLVAEYLQEIDSMEWLLRCQIHFELAKCDEEIEQLQTAEQHLLKALELDDEYVYKEQLEHSLHRLRLRAELYKTPEGIDDQAAMILEQCVVKSAPNDKTLKPALSDLLASLNNKKPAAGQINIHSLLLRAADLLAPNEFTRVLESEMFKNFGHKDHPVTRLHQKVVNYESCIKKGEEHLNERISDLDREHKRSKPDIKTDELEKLIRTDYKQRLKLWFDLSKVARKQQIWDICRVSCRFTLLYDQEKLVSRFLKNKSPSSQQPGGRRTAQNEKFVSLFDRELMRNMAEIHFIFGEALVQYIRQEGIELFEKPPMPELVDNLKPNAIKLGNKENTTEAKSGQALSPEIEKEWNEYCEWLQRLSQECVGHFLRGIQIGVELNESWLVTQGGAYMWNYFHHIIEQRKFTVLVQPFTTLVDSLRKCGHNCEPDLLVAVCVALSNGLISPWLPVEQQKALEVPILNPLGAEGADKAQANDNKASKQAAKLANASQAAMSQVKQFTMTSEASSDFKKALEICDYAMNVTNGENLSDVVSLKARFPLIKTWVLCKQFNQSSIKNLGLSKNTSLERVQDKYTKCMIGIEILSRNLRLAGQGLSSYESKDAPSVRELINLIEQAGNWPDKLIELELWSNLAVMAGKLSQTENLRYCHSKSLESLSYFEKRKSENKELYKTSQLLLSQACISLGEHLAHLLHTNSLPQQPKHHKEKSDPINLNSSHSRMSNSVSSFKDIRLAIRREALNALADGASYAARAETYELVIHASRHYWNLCLPYLQQAQERAYLFDNLREILHSISLAYKFKPKETPAVTATTSKSPTENPESSNNNKSAETRSAPSENKNKKEAKGKKKEDTKSVSKVDSAVEEKPSDVVNADSKSEAPFDPVQDSFDDLTLRCVLYACFFQILIDKQDYQEALEQMDASLGELPRTKHRLLIYRFKVITKSKLGMDVQMDLQKFREESEKNLAKMYRKVALSSLKQADTIQLYQRAIETLVSEENVWTRFEYIVELAEWMYSNEYDLENSLLLGEWAAYMIMFCLKPVKPRSMSVASIGGGGRASSKQGKNVRQASSTNPKTSGNLSILPTIEDNTELKKVEQKIEQLASHEMNTIDTVNQNDKSSMFEPFYEDKSLRITDLTDIRQLECLTRVYIVLAELNGRHSGKKFTNYARTAHLCCSRLFVQAYENAVASLKEIQKYDQAQAEAALAADQGNKKGGKGPAKSDPAGAGTGGKKPGKADYSLPQTIEQWSQFEMNTEVVNAWSHALMKTTGINESTITDPFVFFYFLDMLSEMLYEQGQSHLLFSIYYLQLVLATNVLKSSLSGSNVSLSIYVRIKLINLCTELNLISSVNVQLQQLASYVLNLSRPTDIAAQAAFDQNLASQVQAVVQNPSIFVKLVQIDANEVCQVREQIYSHKKRMAQVQEEEASNASRHESSVVSGSIGLRSQKYGSSTTSLLKQKFQQNVKINEHGVIMANQSKITVVEDIKLPGEKAKLNENTPELLYKDIWLRVAGELVRMGLFQPARDYLNECLNACVNLESKHTLAKVYLYLGQIALFDCNFAEARGYAANAQRIAIDEIFWYKSIHLLSEAHRLDYHSDKEAYDKSVRIIKKAIDVVVSERPNRKNKSSRLAYVEAMLTFQLAEVIQDGLVNDRFTEEDLPGKNQKRCGQSRSKIVKRNFMHPNVFKKLSEIRHFYAKSFALLVENGYIKESIDALKSHARLVKRFADDSHNPETKKEYLLQGFKIYKDGVSLVDKTWSELNAQINESVYELQNVSLHAQRQLVDLKLEYAQYLTDMLETHMIEVREKNEQDLRKDNVVRTVEELLVDQDNLSHVEKEWRAVIAVLPDIISALMAACYSLTPIQLKQLRARIFFLIGRNFRIVAELKHQLRRIDLSNVDESLKHLLPSMPVSKWSNVILEIQKQIQSADTDKSKARINANQKIKDVSMTSQMNSDGVVGGLELNSTANDYLSEQGLDSDLYKHDSLKNMLSAVSAADGQAMDCLVQALNLAIQIENKELMRNIAYEMIEIIGQMDLVACSQLVAFYQSCSNALEMEQIVEKASLDPKNSLITGYLHQLKFYSSIQVETNALNSPIIKQILDLTKSRFNAHRLLQITGAHFSLSKDLPSNYTVLLLQHNQQKTELYCSLLDCSKNQSSAKGKSQAASSSNNKSIVNKMKVDTFQLTHLQEQWREWKNDLKTFNLKLEYQITASLSKKEASGATTATINTATNTDQQPADSDQFSDLYKWYLNSSNAKLDEASDTLSNLNSRFDELIERTEQYLQPMIDFIRGYFESNSTDHASPSGKSTAQPVQLKPSERLVLLADLDLLEFPLESLSIFHNNQNICSTTRDFSLHMFGTRIAMQKESNESQDEKGGKQDKEKAKPNDKKQANNATQPVEPLPESAVIVNHSRLKYYVDVFNESSLALPTEFNIASVFKKLLQQYTAVTGSKWTGVIGGNDHQGTVSLGETERLLIDSDSFIFFCLERFLSYFNSNRVASLNLDCKFVLANDLAQTSQSHSRLGKSDVLRNPVELECENSLRSAVLLSLAGIKTILLNQWSSTQVENVIKFQSLIKEFLDERQSCGEIVHYRASPHLKFMLQEKLREADEKREQSEKDGKDNKKDGGKKEAKKSDGEKTRQKSPAKKGSKSEGGKAGVEPENEQAAKEAAEAERIAAELAAEQERKKQELLDKLSKIRKENMNLVCYGLPDLYMVN